MSDIKKDQHLIQFGDRFIDINMFEDLQKRISDLERLVQEIKNDQEEN